MVDYAKNIEHQFKVSRRATLEAVSAVQPTLKYITPVCIAARGFFYSICCRLLRGGGSRAVKFGFEGYNHLYHILFIILSFYWLKIRISSECGETRVLQLGIP